MNETVTIGATDGTATAAPSAPASERPTTIDAALDQSFTASLAASETPAPDATADPVNDGEAPATAEPQAEGVAPDSATTDDDDKKGPIPFKSHKQALENARLKTEQEVTQRLTQEWETQVKPVLPYAQAITHDVQTGSVNGLAQVIEGYAQHPVLGPQVRSMFGRLLAQQKTPPPPQPSADADPRPEPDFQTADGATFYSAKQQQALDEWNGRQWQKKLDEKVQPFQQQQEQQQLEALRQQVVTKEWHAAAQAIEELRTSDPDFKPHEADVKKRMLENPRLSLDRAWAMVYRDVVTPKKVAQSQQSWVSQALKKSHGSSPDPMASAPAQPRKPRTVDEALDQAFERATAR